MNLLLINTCAAEGLVAITHDNEVVAAANLPARATSENLMPSIREICRSSQPPDAVVVVNGPGSFTGVRAGVAMAKGLCEAWSVPLIALSRLALIAGTVESQSEVVALSDAGRGEFYCGVYRGRVKVREELLRLEEVRALLATLPGVTSEQRVQASLGDTVRLIDEPGAETILPLALERVAARQWSDVAFADANYLRRTDAELLKNYSGARP